jgi:hypothetical protein
MNIIYICIQYLRMPLNMRQEKDILKESMYKYR